MLDFVGCDHWNSGSNGSWYEDCDDDDVSKYCSECGKCKSVVTTPASSTQGGTISLTAASYKGVNLNLIKVEDKDNKDNKYQIVLDNKILKFESNTYNTVELFILLTIDKVDTYKEILDTSYSTYLRTSIEDSFRSHIYPFYILQSVNNSNYTIKVRSENPTFYLELSEVSFDEDEHFNLLTN